MQNNQQISLTPGMPACNISAERIDKMAIGDILLVSAFDGKEARIKRYDRATWNLFLLNIVGQPITNHARWGNSQQIAEDVESFWNTGYLPYSRENWF